MRTFYAVSRRRTYAPMLGNARTYCAHTTPRPRSYCAQRILLARRYCAHNALYPRSIHAQTSVLSAQYLGAQSTHILRSIRAQRIRARRRAAPMPRPSGLIAHIRSSSPAHSCAGITPTILGPHAHKARPMPAHNSPTARPIHSPPRSSRPHYPRTYDSPPHTRAPLVRPLVSALLIRMS